MAGGRESSGAYDAYGLALGGSKASPPCPPAKGFESIPGDGDDSGW
jgi:hypothetical protein